MDLNSSVWNSSWAQTLLGLAMLGLALLIADRSFRFFIRRFSSSNYVMSHPWISPFLKDRRFIFVLTFIPCLGICYGSLQLIPHFPDSLIEILQRVLQIGLVLSALLTLSRMSAITNETYSKLEVSKSRPIKGLLQSVEIIAYFVGIILTLAVLFNKSPFIFISGLGAMTAILLLIFKDTILSFVAGVQLTMNGLIRVGDWIEMPQFNADGDVIEIALHSVKVQNWDRTLTVIPAHKFLENSFKNWRGMQESGGRRIKRAINIDVASIRFLTPEDIVQFSKIKVLENYLLHKLQDVMEHNQALEHELSEVPMNTRRLTNVGTFRAYLQEYLRSQPGIHQNMTFMVRQLPPGPEGLPIEIYVFTKDTRWVNYEAVQADIFDHVLAILPEFDLHFYQKPSGQDVRALRSSSSAVLS